MHRLSYLVLGLLGILITSNLNAQITSDALRFSDTYSISTARGMGTGNALDALGADFSSVSINPAGLAIYRSSEVTLSPIIDFNRTRANFGDELGRDSRTSLALANMGFVFSHRTPNSHIKYVNLGMGINRIASFNQDYSMSGMTTGSRVVSFTEQAQGITPDNLNPFESQLAYDTYLIDNDTSATTYIGSLTEDNITRKTQTVRESGGITEFSISGGLNYKNRLYAGLSLGVNFLRYRSNSDYLEQDTSGNIAFQEMSFREERRVVGTGTNIKFGLIYRINHLFLASLSVHSSTLYGAEETYTTRMHGIVYYNNELQDNSFGSPDGVYPHRLFTPWRASLGLGVILGKKGEKKIGYMGLAVDYINYSNTSFDLKPLDTLGNVTANTNYIRNLNNNVYDLLQPAFRVRFGGAFVIQDIFQIRYGYQLQSSPYRGSVEGVNDQRHRVSLGLGVRTRNFFVDIAYMVTAKEFEYVLYTTEENLRPQQSNINFSGGHILLTIGVRFGGDANL
ncbi:MAG: aromatic hydrocarbon degradation protein [Saprospiraceae bacterium]|nr:aromatic hydrocarbon degradation protein [Saprospiraceae bacterium]